MNVFTEVYEKSIELLKAGTSSTTGLASANAGLTVAADNSTAALGRQADGVAAATGTFVKTIGLGAKYGQIVGIEVKGDDAAVNASTTFAFRDAANRGLLPAMVIDGGDTTRDEYTNQECIVGGVAGGSASTVGDFQVPGYDPARVYDTAGDASAATEGKVMGKFAKSPVTVTGAAGTDGDRFRIGLWVRV